MKHYTKSTLLILILVLATFLGACSSNEGTYETTVEGQSSTADSSVGSFSNNSDRVYPKTVDELDGLRAGAQVGMIDDIVLAEKFPNSAVNYYNNTADLIKALDSNKIDYFLPDEATIVAIKAQGANVETLTDQVAYRQDCGFVFNKGAKNDSKLYQEINEFIAKHDDNGDGKLSEIKNKWVNNDISDLSKVEKYEPELSGKNGSVTVAIDPVSPPLAYIDDKGLQGMDIECIRMFAYEYGYDIDFIQMDFAAIIPAIVSGKADFGASGISITEERSKSVDFSDPYAAISMYPVVAKESINRWSIAGLKDSFNRTFMKEDRWKMVLVGLDVTNKITFISIFFGTILGFLIYLLSRKNIMIVNLLFNASSWLFSGLPMVVILMIMYYIIFGDSNLSGMWVAVIAFSISLMLSVYSMLVTAVKSIDKNEIEGALSLGFTNRQTLFGIVLPEAMTQFIPNYLDELIQLLKGTAIVGYIAVQDLTKVSDIIRSRTYEAFFPLIATALVYLFVVVLITIIIRKIAKKFEPELRSEEKVLKQYK